MQGDLLSQKGCGCNLREELLPGMQEMALGSVRYWGKTQELVSWHCREEETQEFVCCAAGLPGCLLTVTIRCHRAFRH